MIGIMMEMSDENKKHLETIHPFWIEDFVLLQPFPKEESRLTTPIKPFNTTVINYYFLFSYRFFSNFLFNYDINDFRIYR